MEHQPNVETETETLPKPDNFASEYAATIQSRDFGDTRIFPDVDALKELGHYWALELNNPQRSERSKQEINKIIGRVVFEIHSREYPIRSEIAALETSFNLEVATSEVSLSHEQRAA